MSNYSVVPTPANKCHGVFSASGLPDVQLRCLKSSSGGVNTYECVGMKLFNANCSNQNLLCNSLSTAWVAAVTCCQQRL